MNLIQQKQAKRNTVRFRSTSTSPPALKAEDETSPRLPTAIHSTLLISEQACRELITDDYGYPYLNWPAPQRLGWLRRTLGKLQRGINQLGAMQWDSQRLDPSHGMSYWTTPVVRGDGSFGWHLFSLVAKYGRWLVVFLGFWAMELIAFAGRLGLRLVDWGLEYLETVGE